MTDKPVKRYSPPAVEQAGEILFVLAGNSAQQMSLSEICDRVGISGSKAYGILTALEKSRLIKRGRDEKGYSLGMGHLALSRKVLNDIVPSEIADPILDNLTNETRYTSVFGMITDDKVYIVSKKESAGDIRIIMNIGYTMPLTYGAHGKAIVSFMKDSNQQQLLKKEKLYFHGSANKLDRNLLQTEIASCREIGFAFARADTYGISVISAPVLGFTGDPVGFVEIFVPAPEEVARQLGHYVVSAAKKLSIQFSADFKE